MALLWMNREGGSPVSVDERQEAAFAMAGYLRCDPPAKVDPKLVRKGAPVAEVPVVPNGCVQMYRGEESCHCGAGQVAAFEALGWSREPSQASVPATEEDPVDPDPETEPEPEWATDDEDDTDDEGDYSYG